MTDYKGGMRTTLFLHSSADLYGADRCLLKIVDVCRDSRPLVVVPYDGPLVAELRRIKVDHVIRPLAVMRRQCLTPWGLIGLGVAAIRDIFQLGALVRRESVELVYSNTTAIIMGGVVARLNGLRHIQHVREIIQTPRLVGWFISQLGRLADRVVCVSDATRRNYVSFCPALSSRTVVIHDGIDLETFKNGEGRLFRAHLKVPHDALIVGMIGRFSSWKGQDFFVNAAEEFVRRYPARKVCFVIVGNAFRGQEWREKALLERIESSAARPYFRVVQFREDVADILASFDIFTMPSTRPDPFPNTVLEAMSSSKAIVANASGGVVEMLDRESGILIEPNHIDELCLAWERLASDPALRVALGKAACARVKAHFTLSGHLAHIHDLIRAVSDWTPGTKMGGAFDEAN